MFEIAILTVTSELSQNEFDTLLHLVSPEKQERIKQFSFFRDARNCFLGDVLVRVEICRSTGFGMKQLEFTTNEYGKPFLIGRPCIQFNISHAGRYIACAVADEPVGIDIEIMKPLELRIAERFFASDETEYIMVDNHIYRFYEVWTKKESRIKWEGKGLHKSLPSFSVFESNEQDRLIYHEIFQNDEAICYVRSTKQILPSIKVMDTVTFIQSITK